MRREAPLLRRDDRVRDAIVEADVPALPVVDAKGRLGVHVLPDEVARAIGALLTGAAGRDEPTVAGQDEPEEVVQAAMAARLMSVAESMSRVG